jgi:tRNA A58 N-methylase Trm61
VLRGSSRVSDAGRGSGGLQAYLQYSTVFGLAEYNKSAITAGVRYEF